MPKGEHVEFSLPERLNLGSYLLDVNLELGRGDKTAIYSERGTCSFRDLWVLTNKVGNVLRQLGVEPENRVLLVLEDSPEWIASWLAVMKVGGVGTHAYTYLRPEDYEYLLGLVRPKIVIADGRTIGRLREASAHSRYPKVFLVAGEAIPELRERERSLDELLAGAGETLEVEPTHRDDIAFWNFSSGTSGKPKGVPHMHRDTVVNYESFNHYLAYRPEDIVLRVPKLFFHYSRDNGCFFALRSGAAVVVYEERATAALIFDLIRKYRPTVLINVPTMMRAMIQTPKDERADLSCLRYNMSSGEKLAVQLHQEWTSTFGVEVIDRLGSAESGMGYLSNRLGAVIPGSSGQVTPIAEVKVVDEEGREVSRGQPGVLMVRSDASALYYVREHEKSKTTFPGNEWVDTGDLFVQDEKDYFWHVGRVDDMVKVSGIWVSPLEIEHGLHECPGVRECAALAVNNPDGLTWIKAFVVLADGFNAGEGTADELKRFCREKLAPHKVPKVIEFLDDLPKTGQGKIDRRLLRGRPLREATAAPGELTEAQSPGAR